MVMGILLVVVVLANVILAIISSQARLTHHQVSRIQAYYAAQAGMNYALDQLRTGDWTFTPTNSCPSPDGCSLFDYVSRDDFPLAVTNVQIIFCPAGSRCPDANAEVCDPPDDLDFCVRSSADYSLT